LRNSWCKRDDSRNSRPPARRGNEIQHFVGNGVYIGYALFTEAEGEVRRIADPKSLVDFLRIAEQHRGQLLWLAQRLTRNREEAEDIVQEALLKAFTHLALFRGGSQMEPGSASFCGTRAVNACESEGDESTCRLSMSVTITIPLSNGIFQIGQESRAALHAQ
jgi:hypothetical protein